MSDPSIGQYVAAFLALAAVVSTTYAAFRWARPRYQRLASKVTGVFDAILGRDAVVDSITGKELAPPLPGMGVRMAHQEQQMELLAVTVTKLANQQSHFQRLEERVDSNTERIKALEDAQLERVVTRAESAQAWRTIETALNQDNGDAADPEQPDDPAGELDP